MFETMEERILHSADLAPLLVADAGAGFALQQPVQLSANDPQSPASEIVFIDLSVPDANALLDDLRTQRDNGRALQIVTIAADQDGLALISDTLATRRDITAVHVVAHGSDGVMQLGLARLDTQSLMARAAEVAGWGAAITADADLLLYGCDFAQTDIGRQMVGDLAVLTGADVAASSDATGAATLGGNWVLEQRSGSIEAASAASATLQQAWGGLLGNDFQVNITTNHKQTTDAPGGGSQQAVAYDASGNFVVVWTSDNQDGDEEGVYARRFNALGNALTGEIRVAQTSDEEQRYARVASDAAGNFVVTWSSKDQDGDNEGVYLRRFSAAGTALTNEIRVNTTTSGAQVDSAIGMNASTGAFVIAWEGNGTGDSAGVFFRRFAANGSALDASEKRGNQTSIGTEQNAAVAMDTTGRFVVAFDVGNHTYFQRFDAAGTAQGGRTQVDSLLGSNGGAAIAMDGAGNFTIVYREDNISPGVWGRGFNADGSQRYASFYVDSGNADNPSIAMAGDGSFIVGYQKTGTNGNDIFTRLYTASGSPVAAGAIVNQYTSNEQKAPSVALFGGTGHYVAVWSGKSSGDNDGVSARVFAAAPVAPVATPTGGTLAYVENDGPRAVDAGMVVTDADSTLLASATIRIAANFSSGQDMLAFTNQNGITGSWNAGTGVLVLSGSASVGNYQAALRSVTYANTSDAPSTANRTVSFVVNDGQADSVAANRTISVTARNDAPTGASKTITLLEDASYAFTVADFGYADPLDLPANVLLNVRIGTLPLTGSLTLNGVTVTANQFVSAGDIGLGRLVFTPLANASSAPYGNFNFQVQDNGGTANGGVDLDPVARTITLNVTPVNDAPVGADKTVTVLEDAAYTFATTDFGFSDPNDTVPHTLINVRITSLPVAGSLTLSGSALAVNQFISVANINAGNLKFAPVANASGASYASFGFRVQDGGGTSNGGVDLDTASRTMRVNVTPVNDAPGGSNFVIATLEDVPYVFSLGNFGYSDTRDIPANTLLAVKIATLPINGSLQLDGVGVNAGQFVSATDIGNGKLAFVPVANANGSNYASFTFQVQDSGGTTNTGVDLDPTPRTVTIHVTSVNDAPVGTNKTVTLNEDGTFVFSTADFGFTDPNDSPANTLTDIQIASLPLLGSLTLSNIPVTSNQLISAASINAGLLRYTPLPNVNGNAYASFTFAVRDNGGTSNGGVAEDVTARTMTLDVTAVNDAPVNTVPPAQAMANNTILVFSSAGGNAIVISDLDAGGAPVHLTLSVGTGDLTLNGTNNLALDWGTTGISQTSMGFSGTLADINIALNGLQFSPGAVFTGSTTLSIVSNDQGYSGIGGPKSHLSNVVINVSFVNSAPVLSGSGNLPTIFEDAANHLGTSVTTLIGGHVTDSNPGALSGIAVVDVDNSNGGDWQYSGDGGVNWSNFGSPTDGNARLLAADGQTFVRFVPGAHWNGTVLNGLTFRAWDATSGTAGDIANTSTNGGTSAFSMDIARASVTVQPVNDAPVGTDQTISMLEHGTYAFARTDFGFSDPTDSPANALLGVNITSLPSAGTLTLNGATMVAPAFVTVADLDGGNLVFTPTAHGNGVGFASFGFQVRDDGGTANGGLDTDPTIRTMTLDVTSVNDAPQGADGAVATLEDQPYQFTLADFTLTDVNDAPADQLLSVHITTLPVAGRLTLLGVTVAIHDEILASEILAGQLLFVPGADTSGFATFQFQVQDDGGTDNFGTDQDPTPYTMTIDVAAVNDAPTGSDITLVIQEDTSHTFSRADFGFSDPRDLAALPAHQMLAVRIDTLPVFGSLTLDGQLVASGQFISVADIDALLMVFTPAANANGPGYASLTFRVQDDGGIANGGADLDLDSRTITFNVTAVNDAPLAVGSASLADVTEDTLTPAGASVGTLYLGNFSDATDAPASNALAGVAVRALTLDAAQGRWHYSIDAGGNWSEVGAVSDVAALSLRLDDRLRFLPAPGYSGTPNALSVRLIDDSVAMVSGALIDVTANGGATAISAGVVGTATQVLSVNDAPMGQDRTVSMLEDATHTFSLADFGFSDANDVPTNAFLGVHITGVPLQGTLSLAGVAVASNQFIAASLIDTGQLVFRPATHANGAAYATLGFKVQDDGGTTNGGANIDTTVRTLAFDVVPVNDAPTGDSLTVTMPEDGVYVFAMADFGFRDISDTPANALAFVTIVSLPGQGVLTLDGVAVAPTELINAADIAASKLRFAAPANANGASLAAFSFQVQDNGGTVNGGLDTDPLTYTFTLHVSAVDDAPTISAPAAWLVVEDTPGALTGIVFADPDASTSAFIATFSVSSGTLTAGLASGVTSAINAGALVLTGSVADINALIANGQLRFVTAADATDSVTLRIDIINSGTGGTLLGASTLATLNVQAVQDAPRLARQPDNQSAGVAAAARFQLPAASFTDPDAGDTLVYRADLANGLALPGWLRFDPQTLTFSGAPGAADAGVLQVRVYATDGTGASAQAVFSVVVVAPLAEPETVAIDVESATANTSAKPSATQPKEASDTEAVPVEAASYAPAPSAPVEVPALDAGGNESVPTGSTLVFQIDTSALARVQRPFSLVDVSVTPVVTPPPLLAPALLSQLGDITLSSASQAYGQQTDLLRKLEEMRRQMTQESSAQQTQIASAIALSSGLSIGYVIWLIRGGVLLSSMLSALPAWQMLDPLPVLASNNNRRKPDATAADDPEVEQLFDGSRRAAPAPAASATKAHAEKKAGLPGDMTPQDTTAP